MTLHARTLAALGMLATAAACAPAAQAPGNPATAPVGGAASITPVTLDARALAFSLARVRAGDATYTAAVRRLVRDADKALVAPLVAVTDKKTLLAPTNDPHDYLSLSPYWWPDPAKPDGLPYIRRDGETNPESKRDLDQPRVAALGDRVQTLALAWYFTGDRKYADRAAQQVRTWFLDPATRMNPHLRFAQLVRGNPNERGSGIIDTRWFIEVVDAVGILRASPSWSAADQAALQDWMRRYVTWLRTSPNGEHEHKARNNHGSWYAAQVMALAAFTGDTATVRALAQEIPARIGWQFTPEGTQPIELERTRSYHYSGFNAEALSRVAVLAHRVRVDLWRYQAPEGGSLLKAIDHLARYAANPAQWPGKQIDAVEIPDLVRVFRRAQMALGEPRWDAVLRVLDSESLRTDRSVLLYPMHAEQVLP